MKEKKERDDIDKIEREANMPPAAAASPVLPSKFELFFATAFSSFSGYFGCGAMADLKRIKSKSRILAAPSAESGSDSSDEDDELVSPDVENSAPKGLLDSSLKVKQSAARELLLLPFLKDVINPFRTKKSGSINCDPLVSPKKKGFLPFSIFFGPPAHVETDEAVIT